MATIPSLAELERLLATTENRARRQLIAAVLRVRQRLPLSQLERAILAQDLDEAVRLTGLEPILNAVAETRQLTDAVRSAGWYDGLRGLPTALLRQPLLDLSLGAEAQANPLVLERIRRQDLRRIQGITAETEGAIRETLERGIRRGEHPREIARHLRATIGLTRKQAALLDAFRLRAGAPSGGSGVEVERNHPGRVTPLHKAWEREKLAAITERMRQAGFLGRPILAVEDPALGLTALTGSHRLAAARAAGLEEVPLVVIRQEDFRNPAQWEEFVEVMRDQGGMDDEDRLRLLQRFGVTKGTRMLALEVRANEAAEGGAPEPVFQVPRDPVQRGIDRMAARLLKTRTESIARTEVLQALNDGKRAQWDRVVREGVIQAADWAQEWRTAADERTCPVCLPLDGVRVDLGASFPGGYAGPPAHPRCRCVVTAVLSGFRGGERTNRFRPGAGRSRVA